MLFHDILYDKLEKLKGFTGVEYQTMVFGESVKDQTIDK